MSRPRLIRRQPLGQRIKEYLNPYDFLLWLSEHVEGEEWEEFQRGIATPLGLVCNFVFLVARANSGASVGRRRGDDVFGDDYGGMSWLGWLASFIVHLLTYLSVLNAMYTFQRKRHYRLFESNAEVPPSTPSAHRVRVDSSPASSSPLRFLGSMIEPLISSTSAESRSHPDSTRDVWEVAVWDPAPLSLRLFCLFSPGHILVYWLFLPTLPSDPRPSTTILTTLVLTALLSFQMIFLQQYFSQQSKDTSIIHKEVLNEYDAKFVHPRLNPQIRDVATQFPSDSRDGEVQTYTPTTILRRGYQINPNPNYAKHVDPEGATLFRNQPATPLARGGSVLYANANRAATPYYPQSQQRVRQPNFRANTSTASATSIGTGDGGSLGVYTHANSPLKKAASMSFIPPSNVGDGTGYDRRGERQSSPLKRTSVDHGVLANGRFDYGLSTPVGRRESGRF